MKKETVVIVTNSEDWDLLLETLTIDAHSSAFDRDLRSQLASALNRLETHRQDELTEKAEKLRRKERDERNKKG